MTKAEQVNQLAGATGAVMEKLVGAVRQVAGLIQAITAGSRAQAASASATMLEHARRLAQLMGSQGDGAQQQRALALR